MATDAETLRPEGHAGPFRPNDARPGQDASPAAAPERARGTAAPGGSAVPAEEPSVRDIDVLYQETDRLYYELARGCGLSDSAYWILYDVEAAGGRIPQRVIGEAHSLSRQTVNSSIKSLEARGLVRLEFEPGSRKHKDVLLTDEGKAFCKERVVPAMQAEERAFLSLGADERREFMRLVRAYADAVDVELARLRAARRGDES